MPIDKVAVIGLDCCEPSLVFDRWRDDLPNLRRLMRSGLHGDLRWCSVGTVGNAAIFTFENDIGPDDANHAQQGLYILSHPTLPTVRKDASIYDVAPTIFKIMGQAAPAELRGTPLV